MSQLGADTAHVEIEIPYSTGFLEAGGKMVVTEAIDGTPLFKEDRRGIVLLEPFSGRVRPMSPGASTTYRSGCFIQPR